MPHNKKVSDQTILDSYAQTKNIWKTGKNVGLCGQSVHQRLQRLNININGTGQKWIAADNKQLKKDYLIYRDIGKLDILASQMGRTKSFIAKKAKELGLTDSKRPKAYMGVWKYMSKEVAEVLFEKFKKSRFGLIQFCKRYNYNTVGFWKTMTKYFADEWEPVIELKTPKDTMYRRGRAFEYRCRDFLKAQGYFVLRSPASRSPIDLVGIKIGQTLFVQCKRNGYMGVEEWNDLFDLALSVDAKPILASIPASGKGVEFFELLEKKDKSRKAQPMVKILILR